jgi:hypothetical protein
LCRVEAAPKRFFADSSSTRADCSSERTCGSYWPRYEEPGAVTLPRLVFSWLQPGNGIAWSVTEVGTLAVMLSSSPRAAPSFPMPPSRTMPTDSAFSSTKESASAYVS